MASSFTASDILKGALQKAGEKADGTSPYQELAIKCLNNAHIDILSGGSTFTGGDVGDPWPWARARTPKSIQLLPPYSDGAVALTNGSATATLTPAPAVGQGSLKDWYFKPGSSPDFYRIAAHTAGSATVTLESAFSAPTIAADTFNFYKTIYDLGTDVLRLCAPIRIYRATGFDEAEDGKIYGVDVDTLDEKWPIYRLHSGVPDRYAEMYQSETEYLIRMNKFVIEEMKVDLDYIPVPADLTDSSSSIPLIPKQKRIVLEYATAYFLCQEKQHQDMQNYFTLTEKTLRAMRDEGARQITQTNKQRGMLVARQDQLPRNRFRGGY